MAITYPWNPYANNDNSFIKGEAVKTSKDKDRTQFVLRAAPFFVKDLNIYKKGSTVPLVINVDYSLANPFDAFIKDYNRNVFGSVVLLKPIEEELMADYKTIGGPFVLDEQAFAALVANIINTPKTADWKDITNVPTTFPSSEHIHPSLAVYNTYDMMVMLRTLMLSQSNSQNEVTLKAILDKHIQAPLHDAHASEPSDIGLGNVANNKAAENKDLEGNSSSLNVTVAVLKEAFRKYAAGTLDIN